METKLKEKLDEWILLHPVDKELLESRFDLMEPIENSCWKIVFPEEISMPTCLLRRNIPITALYLNPGTLGYSKNITDKELKKYDNEINRTIKRNKKLKRILDV